MKTLASLCKGLRESAKLSLSEAADKTKKKGVHGISRHVIWKLENNRPIKADTLGKILRTCYGLADGSATYLEAFALWSAEQSKTVGSPDFQAALAGLQRGVNAEFRAFAGELLRLTANLPAGDRKAVLEAARNVPALKLWLASRK